jgi:hypothetical protein
MTHRNWRSVVPGVQNWRALYRAVLFERDRQRLPERIAEAERVLIRRAWELLTISGYNIEEEEAVDDALHTLRALRPVRYPHLGGVKNFRDLDNSPEVPRVSRLQVRTFHSRRWRESIPLPT